MAGTSRSPRHEPQATGETPAPSPAGRAMELVAHKWTIHILFALHKAGGPAHFRELQRRVAPIT
jgi:DNA-binding HxlR family transcriptional regulator